MAVASVDAYVHNRLSTSSTAKELIIECRLFLNSLGFKQEDRETYILPGNNVTRVRLKTENDCVACELQVNDSKLVFEVRSLDQFKKAINESSNLSTNSEVEDNADKDAELLDDLINLFEGYQGDIDSLPTIGSDESGKEFYKRVLDWCEKNDPDLIKSMREIGSKYGLDQISTTSESEEKVPAKKLGQIAKIIKDWESKVYNDYEAVERIESIMRYYDQPGSFSSVDPSNFPMVLSGIAQIMSDYRKTDPMLAIQQISEDMIRFYGMKPGNVSPDPSLFETALDEIHEILIKFNNNGLADHEAMSKIAEVMTKYYNLT